MKKHPHIKFKHVDNEVSGLMSVSFHETDVMVADIPIATYYIEKEKFTNLIIAEDTGFSYHLSFASRKELPLLHSILQKTVRSISTSEHESIHRKWIKYQDKPFYYDKNFLITVSVSAGIIILIIIQILIWNFLLRKKVKQRTNDLAKELKAKITAQNALHEHEKILSTLVNNLPGMVYRSRNDSIMTMEYISDGCQKLTGYTAEDFIKNKAIRYHDLIIPEEREYVKNSIRNAVIRKGHFETRYRIQTRDNTQKWVLEIGSTLIRSQKDGHVIEELIAFATDISEEKKERSS